MFRSCLTVLSKTTKNAASAKLLKKCVQKPSNRLLRCASNSSEDSSRFQAPDPGLSKSFKSMEDQDAYSDDNSFQEGEYNEQKVIQQYAEKSVNSVTLLGRVGINPQLRGTETHPVVAFSLATNIQYRPGGPNSGNDLVKKTEWHNVVVFRPHLRESVHNYVAKGSRVMVQGRLMYGSIEDKQGMLRSTTSIVAEDVIRFA
jgi:single-strand DNA-binding protein